MTALNADLFDESRSRIARLQRLMRENGFAGFIAAQHVDLYYLTGSMQAGFAFVPAEGEPIFYVRRSVGRAMKETGVRVEPMPPFRKFQAALKADFPAVFSPGGSSPARIGTEMDVLPAQICHRLAEVVGADGHGELVDGSALIRRVRMIKSAWEIGRIEEAADVVAEALAIAAGSLRAGTSELELMARIEYEIRIRGHIGLMRTRGFNMEIMTGMIAAGDAAAEASAFDGPAGGRGLGPGAPQSVSRRPIGPNEPILIDIGCCIDGYVIDQTRTAVIGSLPDDLAEAYDRSETLLREAERRLMPGEICESLYAAALRQAEEFGLADHFMGYGPDRVKFLGHGIGLEVDEWPVLAKGFADPLEPGMVLAVEPKFTFPGRGVVGIENSYLITAEGPRRLTRSPEGVMSIRP